MGLFTKTGLWIARGLGLNSPQLYQQISGQPSHSGKVVTVDTALQLDTVWACVRLIAQTIATLPLPLYRQKGTGSSVARDHPLYEILHDQPNIEMTATEFWEAMVACVLLWGNAYAQIDRGFNGRVVALTPMRPDRVLIRRTADGELEYIYSWMSTSRTLKEDEVFHIKGFSLDGLFGLSPIALARHSLGSAMAAEEASGSIFKNGMRPSGYMKSPGTAYLTKDQRDQAKRIIAEFKGSENTGGVPLLEAGWSFEQLTIPPDDAQLLQTRAFNVEVIARWFDVPPIMIGHMEKSTAWGTGIEQMMLGFLAFSLRPHMKRIEQAIRRKLIAPGERSEYYAEFNAEGLLRTDSEGRAKLYASLAQNGLRTRNELRALDNMAPHDDGDDLTVQSNLLPIGLLGTVARLPTEKPVDPNAVPALPTPSMEQQL
jgi:HK97 family phage portal protein